LITAWFKYVIADAVKSSCTISYIHSALNRDTEVGSYISTYPRWTEQRNGV